MRYPSREAVPSMSNPFRFIRAWRNKRNAPVEQPAPKPEWQVQRIANSAVYFIIKAGRINNHPVMLHTIDGKIFFATAEEAQAVIDHGMWPIRIENTDTELRWWHSAKKSMSSNGNGVGISFHLDSPRDDHRYGNIYVQVVTDFHAKIAVVPGRYHDEDNAAWAKAKTVLVRDLFAELTEMWANMVSEERMTAISAHYVR